MAGKKQPNNTAKSSYQIAFRALSDLQPYAANARTHSPEQVAEIAASIAEFGWTNPILADGAGMIVAGHGRRLAAIAIYDKGGLIRLPSGEALPAGVVPVIDCTGWTARQKRAYILADNQIALNADWDIGTLKAELSSLENDGADLRLAGFSADDLTTIFGQAPPVDAVAAKASLAAMFGVVPFSVFNAREGWWQERKAAWLALGIQSEIGRGENLLRFSATINEPNPQKRAAAKNGRRKAAAFGQDIMRGEHQFGTPSNGNVLMPSRATGDEASDEPSASGTSIFDPVLCEIAYRWFCPDAGNVLDPFAGGSVRGIVAAYLGRNYTGIELRGEQVEANRIQATAIGTSGDVKWIEGDSVNAERLLPDNYRADFIFSCPPYADLEVYSDDPRDLSTMEYSAFCIAYGKIIEAAASRLAENRFACFVVGDVRDRAGCYRNFVSETIAAFEAAGLRLYNEAILVTAARSLAIRVKRQFEAGRKLGKTHQNVLVFVKGDWRKAVAALGDPQFGAISEAGAETD